MRTESVRIENADHDLGKARYGAVRDQASYLRHRVQDTTVTLEYDQSQIRERPANLSLEPRGYQLELYARAKIQNTIAVLDTGCGKTFVASLLIRDNMWKEEEARAAAGPGRRRKIGFFVVDKVALCMQQAEYLQRTCPGKIGLLYGALGIDNYSLEQWEAVYSQWDFLVVTADILKDCLARNVISIPEINLLVYDECHHCQNEHAFALIQRFYFQAKPSQRPKIFGLTASPVSTKKHPSAAIRNLELHLDATICMPHVSSSLSDFVVRPVERIIEYDTADIPEFEPAMQAAFELLGPWKSKKRLLNNVTYVHEVLGAWSGTLVWKRIVEDAEWKTDAKARMDSSQRSQHELRSMRSAVELVDQCPMPDKAAVLATITPKVRKLLDLLDEIYRNSGDEEAPVVICFCERRVTAYALLILVSDLLKQTLPHQLKASIFVGHGRAEEGDISMAIQRQTLVMDCFRKGTINLLFATSVAEEGIDIPACNYVIRFDVPSTAIQYIQSRGRARKPNSQYVCMIEAGDSCAYSKFEACRDLEKVIRSECTNLPDDRFILDDEESMELSTTNETSGFAALNIVAGYCRSLPRDDFVVMDPQYNIRAHGTYFIATLTCPAMALLPVVTGPRQTNKRKAKAAAAIGAVKLLLERGDLDETFRPKVIHEHEVETEEDSLPNMSRREWSMRSPTFWSSAPWSKFYVTRICTDRPGRYADLLLITKQRLPVFPVFDFYHIRGDFKMTCSNLPGHVVLSASQAEILQDFTFRLLNVMVHKKFAGELSDYPYLLALDSGSSDAKTAINWTGTAGSNYDEHEALPDPFIDQGVDDAVILDYKYSAYYFLDSVHNDLSPQSQMPRDDKRFKADRGQLIRTPYEAFDDLDPPSQQPIMKVIAIRRALNFLHPSIHDAESTGPATPKCCYLIPQYCRKVKMTASLIRMAFLMPSLMIRIDSALLAVELNDAFGTSLPLPALVEAITTPQACHGQNYERMEYLGDAYLKLITTVAAYVHFPTYHEGLLTMQRTAIIKNKNLRKQAKARKLYEIIRTQPFNRAKWRPEYLRLPDEEAIPVKTHKIGEKQIADVVEALIGVAVYHGGFEVGWKVAVKLGVNTFGMNSWNEVRGKYQTPQFVQKTRNVRNITEVEAIFEYSFRLPGYVEQALRHGSCTVDPSDPMPTYQRLELLGDAVLETVVAFWLFDTYPQYDPDRLTTMKSHLVRNKALGSVSEELGLHKCMRHFNASVANAILEYSTTLEYFRKQATKSDYYSNADPPKFMSDIVESTIGAIFLDANFDTRPTKTFFHNHVLKRLDPDIDYSKERPPMEILCKVLQKTTCNEIVILKHQMTQHQALDYKIAHKHAQPVSKYWIRLLIHDHEFATSEAATLTTAKLMLSDAALQKLTTNKEEQQRIVAQYCTCVHVEKPVLEEEEFAF